MTDTASTQPTEPAKLCRSCSNFYAAKYEKTHKEKGCPARIFMTLYDYRQAHGGEHARIDDFLKSLKPDGPYDVARHEEEIGQVIDRVKALEDRGPGAPSSPSITFAGEDDTEPDEDTLVQPVTATLTGPYQPLT